MLIGILRTFILAATISAEVAVADAIEGAESVFSHFFSSFTNADADEIVDLFAEDALFWGTGSQRLVQSAEGIQSYFAFLNQSRPGRTVASAAEISILPLGEDQAMVSGTWQLIPKGQTDGQTLRVSAVVANRNGEWKIVQFHNSRMP